MIIGCRVVRGPDWQWNNQDGGEGHLGTVVEAKKSSSEGSIWIQWDMGIRNKYRNGHGGKFDIRLYDTTSAGAIHPRITCDACLQEQITGIRWKCVDCLDYDLCHKCYMTDKHNLKHTFKRFDFVNSEGVAVPCRLGAVKLKAYGIVEGAKVERKKDANMKGQVVKVKNIENVRCSGVEVKWDNGLVSTCKVGFEGVVELKCTVEAECGSYYRDHLATVINEKEDKLLDGLKQIQVRDDPGKRKLKGGDKVRVKDLPVSVMEVAQDGHGGWNDEMKKAMGLEGVVIKADPDGDVHVAVGGHMWCFNSDLIEFVQAGNIDDVGMGLLSELYTEAVQNAIGAEGGPKVIAAAAKQGDLPLIKKLLEEHEEWVNHQNSPGELTALQIAAHEGHLEVVDYLIAMQADLNMRDSDGDSALLCAAHKDRPEVIKSLLSCGADANLINNRLQTGIYIAAGKGYHNCVAEFLVEHVLCDPNMQDADGDTPLHVAINKNQDKVIEVMLKSPKVDISVSNGRGFNTLQYAALRGCTK
ncbi:E3 ubiquitin-protein ligase MIB2-like [Antedon mediterranea]|uniref:E3 ubiquitin-protein ligase MIB2-like n=1 Tax=Antedon mediterranea TaxID=105859 RepID=UPI003AF5C5AA